MSLVADASVASVLFTDDPRRGAARRVFVAERTLLAPALILTEVANALWKLSRNASPSTRDAVRAYLALELPERLRFVDDGELISDAYTLAVELGHPVYDCLYLALALREGCRLASFDARFAETLAKTRYGGIVTIPT